MSDTKSMVRYVQGELAKLTNPAKAAPMAAYMKTDMPFYGVSKPARVPIARVVKSRFPPVDGDDYREGASALGASTSGGMYLAIGYAWTFRQHVVFAQLDLFERMITEGAWWDFVDELASPIVGKIVFEDRLRMKPVLEGWIEAQDIWLRRSAILCQNRHKGDTDQDMLFDFCLRKAHEKEFFIRKAIGWALREYARTRPDEVRAFLAEHGHQLSGLSRREAAKHL